MVARPPLDRPPPCRVMLAGPAFGPPTVLQGPASIHDLRGDRHDGAAVGSLLDTLDGWSALAENERLVAVLGYEASVALDARLPQHPRDASLVVDACVLRGHIVDAPSFHAPGQALQPRLTAPRGQRAAHGAAVVRTQQALHDGVAYQANVAWRAAVQATAPDDAEAWWRTRVATRTPACAAAIVLPGRGALLSLSPERFVCGSFRTRDVATFPIKGTRPRGQTPALDRAEVDALCASEKDRAEHVMIVDLLRNDLSRVSKVGSVTVESLMHVVSTTSVHHLESTISARLRPEVGARELLAACAPGGSITGAPKSSAIELIHAVENGPRGPYTGVLFVVDRTGAFTSSLLIRTWVCPAAGAGALHVGGGIVVDSDAALEWQETLNKARTFGDVAEVD